MFKNLRKKKKGFTLIELIIVIAIIAILAAVSLPKFGDIRKSANRKADIANAKNIHSAVITFVEEGGTSDAEKTAIIAIKASRRSKDRIEVSSGSEIAGKLQSLPTGKATTGNFQVWSDDDDNMHVGLLNDTTIIEVYPTAEGIYEE